MDRYLQEAINEYEKNIESGQPFYMEASTLMDIEEVYEKAERDYDAERLMRFAEKLHPDNEEILVTKAYREKDRGHWQEATDIIKNIANQGGRNIQLFYIEKEVASGQIDKAEKRICKCLPSAINDETYDWYLDFGVILLDYGFCERAIGYLEKIPENYLYKDKLYEFLTDAYAQQQKYDKCIEYANKLTDIAPYNSTYWIRLAELQKRTRKYEDCIQSCDYALAIDENKYKAMSLKVHSLFALGRNEEGLKACNAYIQKAPNEYSIRMYAGEALQALERFEESILQFNDALRLCPMDSPDRIHIVVGLYYDYLFLSEFDKAEEMYMSTMQLGNSLMYIYLQMANTYLEIHQVSRALKIYKIILSHPDCMNAIVADIARDLINGNCFEEAKDIWEKVATYSTSEGGSLVNAYCVWAMFILKNKKLLLSNLQCCIPSFVGKVIQQFGPILGTFNFDDILEILRKESKTW